jgi:uncharacterized protein DUF2848
MSSLPDVRDLVIAGWTGRNAEALEKHMAELEAIGVRRPKSVPCFYRVSAALLTSAETVDVVGAETSGEVEVVLFSLEDGLWVGVGSDHTDRRTETFDISVSKQACPKPVSPQLWRYSEVADHWDKLTLRSYAVDGRERHLYQEGKVTHLRAPEDLIRRYTEGKSGLPPSTAMFCGTLPALNGVKGAPGFEIQLEDPVLGRILRHRYQVRTLPLG